MPVVWDMGSSMKYPENFSRTHTERGLFFYHLFANEQCQDFSTAYVSEWERVCQSGAIDKMRQFLQSFPSSRVAEGLRRSYPLHTKRWHFEDADVNEMTQEALDWYANREPWLNRRISELASGIYVWKGGYYTRFNLNEISFSDDKICIADTTMSVDAIDSITFKKPTEACLVTDTVYISYNGTVATVSPQNVEGITTEVNGAAVNIVNTNMDREMTFVLSGKSDKGSFIYEGNYKACIRLAGVSLKSTTGAALDIRCGKRIALELANGTDNYLSDAKEDLNQKAALYCKGHLEVSGGGTLSVKGNARHAISTKEYLFVKKTTGKINITGAANDGIHVGQYFKITGGVMEISGTAGDGIHVEATEKSDDYDGQIIIKGGIINVNVSGTDVAAIKSDSVMSISDGNLSITTTGDADKGLKSKTDILINGGIIDINNSGSGLCIGGDTITAKGVTSDGSIYLLSGSITIQMSGPGGKGIRGEAIVIGKNDNEGPLLNVSSSGTRFANTSSAKAIKATGSITINGGESIIMTSSPKGEGMESKLKSDSAIVFNGGKHYFKCHDDCINSAGAIKFEGGIVVCHGRGGNDAIDSNYHRKGAVQIGNGVVLSYSASKLDMAFDCDENSYIQVTGNGIAIGAGGNNSGGGNYQTDSIGSSVQGYLLTTTPISYKRNRYYTLSDANGNNLITYSFDANVNSILSFFTATGMKSGNSYTVRESLSKPTDATTEWHGIFLDSNTTGTNIVTSFTAK